MVNEYKETVLIKGLENMKDYTFRTIKSLLRKELNLTKKMQDDYDRIQLADLLEDKFPRDAGLSKLIQVCAHIEELKELTKNLKREKAKVQKKNKEKEKMAVKKRKQDALSTSESPLINNETNEKKSSLKKKRKQTTKPKEGKKKKPAQEQTHHLELLGSDMKKEKDDHQIPHEPPPTPPSISSNKKKRKQTTKPKEGKKKKLAQEQTQLPGLSGSDMKKEKDDHQILHEPPPTPLSISSNKKKRKQITKPKEGKKKKLAQEQTQLPGLSGSDMKKEKDDHQIPHEPPPTPPSISSNKKKRKQTTKPKEGKKKKLAQEQTQLPGLSGSDMKKEKDDHQIPHEPPPTPPSISSNKKDTITRKHSITKTASPQTKHQRVEFPATSNVPAVPEILTLERLSANASTRLQSSQNPLEAQLGLKMPPGSPKSPCQNYSLSLISDSKFHLKSTHVPSTLFSAVPVHHVPSATAFSTARVPLKNSETVLGSFSAPRMSPITTPSSIQDFRLPTRALISSTEASHSQAIASRSVQTTKDPSATGTSKAHLIKLPSPATASSNSQDLHTLATMSRSTSVTQVPQRTTSHGVQVLNSAILKAPKNTQTPQISSPIVPSCFQASKAPPSATPSSLTAPQLPMSIATSRAQNTQIYPGTGSICVQALHPLAPTVFRSVCPTQLMQGTVTSTGNALPLLKVKTTTKVQAPQMTSATASSSLMSARATSATASNSVLAPQLSLTATSKALHATLLPSATNHSSPSRTPSRGPLPKEPSREEGHQQEPKQVMVLKVTDPFTYDMKEDKRMFHATVATETEFFRVKVFDTTLKSKFIPRNIIVISEYFGCNGFLEIYSTSCVSYVSVNQTMVVPTTLRQRANATPKISYLFSQPRGTFVNGKFLVITKTERNNFIYYGIEDDTGKMEVVVDGQLTNIKCEPGNKLRLICFELTSTEDVWQLKSVEHSYMQVINPRM